MKIYNFKAIEAKSSFKNFQEMQFSHLPEICFTGRSNVGKSSLINAILNRKTIATTSNKPGHTQKIFLFTIDKQFILVDLPGYGYAQISKNKKEKISELLNSYLLKRQNLRKVFLLLDSRRGLKEIDISFLEFLADNRIDFKIIFTKADKISKKNEELLISNFSLNKLTENSIPFFTSAKTKLGIKDIRKEIIKTIN
ncbi:MAG: YihA family ribosome biogenesis GTP-binding protein [Rickettsiales bacterium TMED254]|nr:YihA family ribosome biogenesis GTP-binding protein [Rickettsiales bacterium]RPF77328.1 MAG: YihA family ribosome biogenesis GTP-binding protein [Rickettsiales bacterium TMED254]